MVRSEESKLMSRLTPVSCREFIRRLQNMGFDGPYSGGRHQFMIRGNRRIIFPNPHRHEISVGLLGFYGKQGSSETSGSSHYSWGVLELWPTRVRGDYHDQDQF